MTIKLRIPIMIAIMTMLSYTLIAQSNVDSLIASLHNKDVTSEIQSVAPSKTADSGKVYIHTWERILTSINVRAIRKSFPQDTLLKRLVSLLDESDKDWYADLLLYNLTRVHSTNIVACDTREKWLAVDSSGQSSPKQRDVLLWRNYIAQYSASGK